jgi:hypothetical protein
MYTAEQLIKMAVKGITDSNALGANGILLPTQRTQFLQKAELENKILQMTRRVDMQTQIHEIDNIVFSGRMLSSAKRADGTNKILDPNTDSKSPSFGKDTLIAKKMVGLASIHDEALDVNIERTALQNTILDLVGRNAGEDIAEYAIFADDTIPYATDDLLCLGNGWAKKAGQKLYGLGAGRDFDPTQINVLLEQMLLSVPKVFLKNVTDWKYFLDFDYCNAYRNYLATRPTNMGDAYITTDGKLIYKGIEIVYEPTLEKGVGNGTGRIAMLSNPVNMVWGVFKDVKIVTEREEKAFRTDIIASIQGDAGYEEKDAAVVAFIDKQRV